MQIYTTLLSKHVHFNRKIHKIYKFYILYTNKKFSIEQVPYYDTHKGSA